MDTAEVIDGARHDVSRSDQLAGELYAHGPVLLAAARVITLDNTEAEDLVQTTFEIAIRNIEALRDPRAMRAWLLRIQAREAVRIVRRLRRLVSLDGRVAEIANQGPDAAQRVDVRRALSRLPRRTRAAIALHHMAGLSVAATADALGVSENTVKRQLRTGLRGRAGPRRHHDRRLRPQGIPHGAWWGDAGQPVRPAGGRPAARLRRGPDHPGRPHGRGCRLRAPRVVRVDPEPRRVRGTCVRLAVGLNRAPGHADDGTGPVRLAGGVCDVDRAGANGARGRGRRHHADRRRRHLSTRGPSATGSTRSTQSSCS